MSDVLVTSLTGPCLSCDARMSYERPKYGISSLHSQYGDDWVTRLFQEKDEWMDRLRDHDFRRGRKMREIFTYFVCKKCRDSLRAHWQAEKELAKQKLEFEDRQRDRSEWLRTWRQPGLTEYDRSTGRRTFLLRESACQDRLALFRWRINPRGECRGVSPQHRVGVWTEGKLIAHYRGWELSGGYFAAEGHGEEVDLFGPGLAVWMECVYQSKLAQTKPDAVWHAKTLPIGRLDDNNWPGASVVHASNEGCGYYIPHPAVIHTVWHDGSVYAQVRNVFTVEQAIEFAWTRLQVELRESAYSGDAVEEGR